MHENIRIRQLPSLDEAAIAALADVLIDCVEGGASVSFLQPLQRSKAEAFWRNVARDVNAGERIVFVAEDVGNTIVGTVQAILAQPDNQPHRADVAKLLVHRKARRMGVGTALMQAVEQTAARAGKTVLVLDTETGSDAERLYPRLGWQLCGRIPDYAMRANGGLVATTIFYKQIGAAHVLLRHGERRAGQKICTG